MSSGLRSIKAFCTSSSRVFFGMLGNLSILLFIWLKQTALCKITNLAALVKIISKNVMNGYLKRLKRESRCWYLKHNGSSSLATLQRYPAKTCNINISAKSKSRYLGGQCTTFCTQVFLCICRIKVAVFLKFCREAENHFECYSCHLIFQVLSKQSNLKNKVLLLFAQTYQKKKEVPHMEMSRDNDQKRSV